MESGQIATYLLQLFQRRMVHAEFLKVVARHRDYLVDDLLVDVTLVVAVSQVACTLTPLARALGTILTTTWFDIAIS